MKKRNDKGEGYIELCVALIVFALLAASALQLFGFLTLRIQMERAAEELLEIAQMEGSIDSQSIRELLDEWDKAGITAEINAERNVPGRLTAVQLGNKITVTVYAEGRLGLSENSRLTIPLSIERTGMSKRYWK